jgi:thiamine biosynthesis lipoprotein
MFAFEAIGTKWTIEVFEDKAADKNLLEKIHARIKVFDQAYSRFRDDSLVSKLATNLGTLKFPEDLNIMMNMLKKNVEF